MGSYQVLNNVYNEHQDEYNRIMAKCDEQLKTDKSSNDCGGSDLENASKTLPVR